MSIVVPSYGVYSDDVGLRYLIQGDGEVSNALGFNTNPRFKVKGPKYNYKCPHQFELQDYGCPNDDPIIQFLSPIPYEQKAMVYTGDLDELTRMAGFSQADALSGWMINNWTCERMTLASNIGLTIIMNATVAKTQVLEDLLVMLPHSFGKVILHGDFYFPSSLPRFNTVPVTDEDPAKVGMSNLFKYLQERG